MSIVNKLHNTIYKINKEQSAMIGRVDEETIILKNLTGCFMVKGMPEDGKHSKQVQKITKEEVVKFLPELK